MSDFTPNFSRSSHPRIFSVELSFLMIPVGLHQTVDVEIPPLRAQSGTSVGMTVCCGELGRISVALLQIVCVEIPPLRAQSGTPVGMTVC